MKKLLLPAILIFLFALTSVSAIGTVIWVQDDFNRADGALGTATNGNAWYNIVGTTQPAIENNRAKFYDNGVNPVAWLEFNTTGENRTTICADLVTSNNAANTNNIIFYSGVNPIVRIDFINQKYARLQYSGGPTTLNISYIGNNLRYTFCINQTNTTYFNVSVNGVKKGSSFRNYLGNAGYIDRVYHEGNSAENQYLDNITAYILGCPVMGEVVDYQTTENLTSCAYYPFGSIAGLWAVYKEIVSFQADECQLEIISNSTDYAYQTCAEFGQSGCTIDLINTSSGWTDLTSCLSNSSIRQSMWTDIYDNNSCEWVNDSDYDDTGNNPPQNFILNITPSNTTYTQWDSCVYVPPADESSADIFNKFVVILIIILNVAFVFIVSWFAIDKPDEYKIFVLVLTISMMLLNKIFLDSSTLQMIFILINVVMAVIYFMTKNRIENGG